MQKESEVLALKENVLKDILNHEINHEVRSKEIIYKNIIISLLKKNIEEKQNSIYLEKINEDLINQLKEII